MSNFKNNIGELLTKKGITQKELAALIGATETSISRYVNGDRIPKGTTCIQIAKVLDCKVEELYTLQKEKASRGMTEQEAIEYIENHGYISDDVKDMAIKALEKQHNNGWIPVEEDLPEPNKYVLLSFSNCSTPEIGRYEEDNKGGAFYLGDEEETCISQMFFVNAWMPLPEPYKESE